MREPLFALTHADGAILVTPQRNLSEFDFAQIEAEAGEVLGRISKDAGVNVVVDFSKVNYCGSTALGFFTRLHKKTRCRGGEMAFCNVSPQEREVLHVTRLDTVWPVYDSVDDALAAVTGPTPGNHGARWVVVADRAIARIFEQQDGSDANLRAIATLRHPESREHFCDKVTDGPGTFRGGAIPGSESGEPNVDHRHNPADGFARELASYLEAKRQQGSFEHLVVVAAPLFLGALRSNMSTPFQKIVEHEVAKDYTHLDGERIRTQLAELAT